MKNKTKFGRFLSNNVTLFVLSIVISLVIWFVINAGSEVESNVPINNIKIDIELSKEAQEEGLSVFTKDELLGSVEVSGNRLTVGSLTSSDIQIVALDAASISVPGQYELDLTAKKTGVRTNYSFASAVTPSSVEVYVDRSKEKTFDIFDEIVYKIDSEYYNNSTMSEAKVNILGPETIVNSIDKVVVRGEMDGDINESTSKDFDLVLLDKDGNDIKDAYCKCSVKTIKVTMKPIPKKEVHLNVELINAPMGAPSYKISPNKIKIAAEQDVLDSIENDTITIGTLDFSQLLNREQTLDYDITLPSGCKNLSGTTKASVKIDLSNYSTKQVLIEDFKPTNIDLKKYSLSFNSATLSVKVCGPQELLNDISAKDIIASVDFTDKLDDNLEDSFSIEMPLKFSLTSTYKKCWVYGNYSTFVSIQNK